MMQQSVRFCLRENEQTATATTKVYIEELLH